MIKPEKLSPETIFNTLIPCLPMDSLYSQFESFISEIINQIYSFKFSGNNKEDLKRFLRLQISKKPDYKDMINGNVENVGYTVILTMMGISREQMKNIIAPNHPSLAAIKGKITEKKIFSDPDIYDAFTELLLSGQSDADLAKILNGDVVTLKRFNLENCSTLKELFSNEAIVRRLIEDTYRSRMGNKKGYSTETSILASIVEKYNIPYEAGELPILEQYFIRQSSDSDAKSRNPRIDLILPSKSNPKILIESTYQLTTASGQTKKIDANDSLFRAIKEYSMDSGQEVIFINFIDGAGWKSRGFADVSRLVSSCDYAINFNNLGHFEEIIKFYFNK